MVYDNTPKHFQTEESVRQRLTDMGFPEETHASAVMYGTDIGRFLPTKQDTIVWETQELDRDLMELLCETVKRNAARHKMEWGDAEARKQVYMHLFLRDWEQLALGHADGEQWWHEWQQTTHGYHN